MSRALFNQCITQFEVENFATDFLNDRPPSNALIIAATSEKSERKRWAIEKEAMLKRSDPRPVYDMSSESSAILSVDTASLCISDVRGIAHLLSLYATLPADAAALTSIRVSNWAAFRARMHQP